MEAVSQYIRIGTTYYKTVKKPLASGDFMVMLIPWSVECIKQDHGKSFLSEIPKYDGFCFVPSHLQYQRIIGNFYNRYYPFAHFPKEGKPVRILAYLEHILVTSSNMAWTILRSCLKCRCKCYPFFAWSVRSGIREKQPF